MRTSSSAHSAFIQDISLLTRFDLTNLELGIKLHQDSDPSLRDAAQRLFRKGIITASDGGYLTPFGVSLLEHLNHLTQALHQD